MDAMELIAITTPYFYPGEAEAIADALLNRGFSRVHIRKPGATSADMYRLLPLCHRLFIRACRCTIVSPLQKRWG